MTVKVFIILYSVCSELHDIKKGNQMRLSFMLVGQFSVFHYNQKIPLHLGLDFFISISINILSPFFNQRRMINIVHSRNKVFNKKVICFLFFIIILVLIVNQMHIFLNMWFLNGVCYEGNCFFFHEKICIHLINQIDSQSHIIWKNY